VAPARAAIVGKVAELLERSGIDIDDVGRIDKVTIGDYQAITKDADGVAQIHGLQKASLVLSPTWADGPAWPVVQPAEPVVIQAPPRRKAATLLHTWRTAVCYGDNQIGFRIIDGTLDPFHDEAAMDVAVQVTAALHHDGGLDEVVNTGDYLDLAQQSRWVQEAAFAQTTQPAIDRGHSWLAQVRAAAPNARMTLVEGNHDKRLQNFITTNALSAFGIRRANLPKSWPVLSLPHVLRLDELDVGYVDAWPAGEHWINDRVRVIHGNKVRSGGSTAQAVVKDLPNVATLMGHIHRIETHFKTIHDRSGPVRSAAVSVGCLCRTDGAVPSVNGATGIDGRPAVHHEDWQQGLAIVRYTDDDYRIETHQIVNGVAVVGGQEFRA
jgi:hypothetical protein